MRAAIKSKDPVLPEPRQIPAPVTKPGQRGAVSLSFFPFQF